MRLAAQEWVVLLVRLAPQEQEGLLVRLAAQEWVVLLVRLADRKSTRLNSSHSGESRMPSSA